MTDVLAVVAVVLSVVALGVAALTARQSAVARTRSTQRPPVDLDEVSELVTHLRADAAQALRHISVVRYDAFGDMGGHLSWSLALLDDGGDGILVTAIHGRSDARTYAKNVTAWTCEQQTSPEEQEALQRARPVR